MCCVLNIFLLSPLKRLFTPQCSQTTPHRLMLLYLRNVPSSYPSLPGCLGGEYQRKLYRDLMNNYNRLERPVQNDSAPIVVELGLTLLQIIDVVSVYTRVRVQWAYYGMLNVPPLFALFTVCMLFPSDLFSNWEEHPAVSALHCTKLACQKSLRLEKL